MILIKKIDSWLEEYEESILKDCSLLGFLLAVHIIIIGITGLLWSLPFPEEFKKISPLLNWSTTFLMVTAVYYFIISISIGIGSIPFLLALSAIQMKIYNANLPILGMSTGLIVFGIFFLAIYRKGSFTDIMKDFQLIMIGPAWLLSLLYKRYGISI